MLKIAISYNGNRSEGLQEMLQGLASRYKATLQDFEWNNNLSAFECEGEVATSENLEGLQRALVELGGKFSRKIDVTVITQL